MEEELGAKMKQLSASLDVLMRLQKRAASLDFQTAVCERGDAPPLCVTKERIGQYKLAWKQNFQSLQRDYRVSLSYSAKTQYRDRVLGTFRPKFQKKLENLLGELPTPLNVRFVLQKLEQEEGVPLEKAGWGQISLRESAARILGMEVPSNLDTLRQRLYSNFVVATDLAVMPSVIERYLHQRKHKDPVQAALGLYPDCDQLQLKTRHPGMHALAMIEKETEKLT